MSEVSLHVYVVYHSAQRISVCTVRTVCISDCSHIIL